MKISLSMMSFVLVGLFGGWSCTSASFRPVVTSDFTDNDEALFEDGLDVVHDPTVLDGRWLEDWQEEIKQRVNRADVIAEVSVHTVKSEDTPEGVMSYRLVSKVTQVLYGKLGDEVVLSSLRDSAGFLTVREHYQDLNNTAFIVYIKWALNDAGEIRPRFHLSPASEAHRNQLTLLAQARRYRESPASHKKNVINF